MPTETFMDPGPVLLRSRFRPLHAVGILAVGCFFLLPAADGLFWNFIVPTADAAPAFFWACFLIGALATLRGALLLLRPPTFVEATASGLILHRLPDAPARRDAPARFFLPWTRIRGLDYEEHVLIAGIRKTKTATITVRLHPEGEPVPEGFSHLLEGFPNLETGAVYLDATSGSPGGRDLLQELEALRR